MNIVLAIQNLNIGGSERQVVELAIGLSALGHNIRICCINQPGDFVPIASKAGIPVDCLNKKYHYDAHVIFRLASYLRQHKAKVLQSYLFGANFWGRFAGRLAAIPVLVTSDRSGARYEDWFELWSDRLFWRLADAIISNTKVGRERVHVKAGVPLENIHVVGNGLAKERFADLPTKASARSRLGLPADGFLVVISASMRPIKNGTMVMGVANALWSSAPDAYFLIAGGGPDISQMQEFAIKYKINDRVLFLGQRLDIPEILAAVDVGVLCSKWEGFSNSIMEYMAGGLPVVSTDVGGVRDLVKPDVTGFLVPSGDVRTMVEKILWLKNNQDKTRQMGQAGKEWVFENCGFLDLASKTLKIYDEILKRKGPPLS